MAEETRSLRQVNGLSEHSFEEFNRAAVDEVICEGQHFETHLPPGTRTVKEVSHGARGGHGEEGEPEFRRVEGSAPSLPPV